MDKMSLILPSHLETNRLVIRRYEEGDGKELYQMLERNNNRKYLKEFVDELENIKTKEDAEKNIQELSTFRINRTRFVIDMWLKSSGNYIGQIWIEPNKWEVPSFELGWYVESTLQKQGLATEAAKAAIQFLFKSLKAHKIIIITRDDNRNSYKLAERLGFIKEGHLREHIIKKNGNRIGLLYYGMLKDEWFKS
ncbi:MAG: GNAT family N-acetyltransferase [Promethearchaeota archaeon]